jgi:hypothetical protein
MDAVWVKLQRRIHTACERASLSPDEHGSRAGRNVAELRLLKQVIDTLIDDEIVRGHDQGAAWTVLGGTKQYTYGRYQRRLQSSHRHPMVTMELPD